MQGSEYIYIYIHIYIYTLDPNICEYSVQSSKVAEIARLGTRSVATALLRLYCKIRGEGTNTMPCV